MTTSRLPSGHTKGRVLHSEARYYDLLAWMLTLGRERAFRERLVELARLAPGEVVLDVGCGTGALAVAAKQRVGPTGSIHGIDASPEMIDRAKRKAAHAGIEVTFQTAIVEALPFPDASFDAVLSTLMLHHLPRPVREQCAREMRRVLKPGGRVLAVDFATPARERKGVLARVHRHGYIAMRDIISLLSSAGLRAIESGSVGVSDLQFVLATAPGAHDSEAEGSEPAMLRSLDPLPTPRWVWLILGLVLLLGHGMAFHTMSGRLVVSVGGLVAGAIIVLLAHSTLTGVVHGRWKRSSRR